MISWLQTIWKSSLRRLCSLIVLVSVCLSLLPLPLPSPKRIDKDQSQPFPCQNRPCGCRSAAQCWKKCCCFSNSQKIAWAKTNCVAVPEHVHTAAAQESKSPSYQEPSCAKKSKEGTCCRTPEKKSGSKQAAGKKSGASKSVEYVIGILAEQCRGESSFLNLLPWAVIPDAVSVNIFSGVAFASHGECLLQPAITYQPPTPPPRASLASVI